MKLLYILAHKTQKDTLNHFLTPFFLFFFFSFILSEKVGMGSFWLLPGVVLRAMKINNGSIVHLEEFLGWGRWAPSGIFSKTVP